MLAEPILDLRRLVATDVVQDHVDSPLRVVGEDAVQEAEEVPGTVPVLALSLNLCRRHVQGCKQLGGAVPFIVMRPPSDLVRRHGQLRLTAVQRLHLRLLIHAKHHGILRRVRVQTHNIDEFFPKLGIIGLGERSNSMGALVQAISTTRRRSSSVYLMGVRFLGRLAGAGKRPSANRLRHRVTLRGDKPTSRAMIWFSLPSAASRTTPGLSTPRAVLPSSSSTSAPMPLVRGHSR